MKGLGFEVRCGKCSACTRTVRTEWYNRMLMECYGIGHLPLFLTMTYDSDHYVDNKNHVLKEAQKYFKRLRKAGHDIRYFMCIERGSKRNRLHNHAIIWSETLSYSNYQDRWRYLYEKWGNGALDCQTVQSPAALRYVSKYVTKNIERTDTIADIKHVKKRISHNEVILNGTQYTWSNRPPLGYKGLLRWRQLILHRHKWRKYNEFTLPPGSFRMLYQGKQYPVYIPKSNYVKLCKDMGINLALRYQLCEENVIDELKIA